MDNHPIPQDVTGFQFRLIGNMTVKQFAYIAVGAVGAVIIFYVPTPGIFIFLKILLIPLFILGGIALAFLPIEGRPIDIMATQFLKALFAPNQFMYQKEGGHLLLSTIHIEPRIAQQANTQSTTGAAVGQTHEQKALERQQQLTAYLNTLHQNQSTDEKEADRLSGLFASPTQAAAPAVMQPTVTSQPAPVIPQPQAPIVTPAPSPVAPVEAATPSQDTTTLIQQDTEKIAQEDLLIKQVDAELTQAKSDEASATGTTTQTAHAKVIDLEQKMKELMAAKQALEQELQSLKQTQTVTVPQPQPTVRTVTTPPVATVPVTPAPVAQAPAPKPAATAGFPNLPDVPNILLGIVRDSSGNVLPHILVEVKDAEENPVRAFKTNQLGQFMSATPLKEGTYTVTFEDAKNQYRFDPVTVTINNQILQPLEIAAHDLREELRKSLFA